MYQILERNIARTQTALELSKLICNLSLESLEEQAYVYFKKLHPSANDEEINRLVLGELVLDGDVVNGVISNPKTIEAPDDYTKRFKSNVSFVFRGVFKHTNGKYYRPYAYINKFGFPDIFCSIRQQVIANKVLIKSDYSFEFEKNIGRLIKKELANNIKKSLKIKNLDIFKNITKEERGLHYANNDDDICMMFDNQKLKIVNSNEKNVAVLFSSIEDSPPSFFKVCENPEDSVLYFKNNNAYDLKEYGYDSYIEIYNDASFNSQLNLLFNLLGGHGKLFSAAKSILEHHFENSKNDYFEILKNKILKESKIERYGFINLKNKNGELLAKAPYLPFAHWALRPINERKSLPSYISQSPVGLKMQNDDPFHSDWMIAAGLDLDTDYDGDVQNVANDIRYHMQRMVKNVEYMVLSNGGVVSGKVRFCTPNNVHEVEDGDIVVIPNGNIDYQLHVEKAIKSGNGGVICEVANRVAHLVLVGKERKVTIMHMEHADFRLKNDMIVTLCPDKGTITVI